MPPNLRQPKSLLKQCYRAMIVYLWKLPKQLRPIVKPTNKRPRTRPHVALPPSYVAILQSYLECRIPRSAYDGLRMEFLKFMETEFHKNTLHNDKRKRCKSFLRMVRVYGPVWRTVFLHGQFLDFSRIPSYLQKFYWRELECMQGLQSIDLVHICPPSDDSAILRCIANWSELQHLRLFSCSDTILVALRDACPKLRTLDVSYSAYITDDSVDIIGGFREMQSLAIHGTSLTLNGYRRLMDCLPRLERLEPCRGWPDYSLDQYTSGKTFALTHFDGRSDFTTGQLQFLSKHCPNLSFISIIPHENNLDVCDLTHLCAIDKLSALRLKWFPFHTHKIRDVLQVKGDRLVYLNLGRVGEMNTNVLILISKYCPNLEELILDYYPDDKIPSHCVERVARVPHPFQHLKQLSLTGLFEMDHLEYLLGDCLNIVHIRILSASSILYDMHIDRILARNPLQHVRTINLYEKHLTIATAQRLVQTCPELQFLYLVSSWNVTRDELESFECYLREHNSAVELEVNRTPQLFE